MRLRLFIAILAAGTAAATAQVSNPIYNGVLQTNLNANNFGLTNLNSTSGLGGANWSFNFSAVTIPGQVYSWPNISGNVQVTPGSIASGNFAQGNTTTSYVVSTYKLPISIGPNTYVLSSNGTDVVFSAPGGGGTVVFSTPGGRLTTESGVPVSTSDRTAQGTLYYTPYKHNNVYTYTGSAWQAKTFSEISLALVGASGKNFDVFINAAATTLSLSNAWTNDTTRADALGTQDGVTVLSSDHTKLWLGTIRASGANVTEDSAGGSSSEVGGKRYVWNVYNQVPRRIAVIDTTNFWSYTADTIRQANSASGNKIEYVTGDATTQLDVSVCGVISVANNSARGAKIGAGIDSTTAFSGLVQGAYYVSSPPIWSTATGRYVGTPGLGYHYASWNEKGADGSSTFFGNNGGDSMQTGLTAILQN